MELNKIYHSNCLDLMRAMPDRFIDLTVTSPPYDNLRDYKGFKFPFKHIARHLYRVTKDGGVVVWVVGDATVNGSESGTSFRQALFFMECGFRLHDTMIWVKDGTPFPDKTRYYQSHEFMFILKKPGANHVFNPILDRINKKYGQKVTGTDREANGETNISWGKRNNQVYKCIGPRFNVWMQDAEKTNLRELHPAIFPEQLAADHIKSWSNEGDLVYDPFGGSGTTAKMAHLLKRNWILSEISGEYCQLAQKRIDPYLNQTMLF